MFKEETGSFEIVKLIPTMITMSSLCLGLLAVRLAIIGDFESATYCIVAACVFDGLDGNIARKLNASSEFGAQMDSLADFFNFGIAPGFTVYFWKMQYYDSLKKVSWIPVLMLALCMAIRLARFNVDLEDESDMDNPLKKYFFKGVPAPMAAALVMLPLLISLEYPSYDPNPISVILNTIIIALLAGGTIPTPCFKKIKFKAVYRQMLLVLIGCFVVGLILKTYFTCIVICVLYLVIIVISWIFYIRFKGEIAKNDVVK